MEPHAVDVVCKTGVVCNNPLTKFVDQPCNVHTRQVMRREVVSVSRGFTSNHSCSISILSDDPPSKPWTVEVMAPAAAANNLLLDKNPCPESPVT